MSIKKGKKQVYKVKCPCMCHDGTVHDGQICDGFGSCSCISCFKNHLSEVTKKLSPLKPKKCNHLYDLYGKSNLCVYCRKPKPKKSIKKMYKAKIVCGNCPKSQYVQIPFGTRVIEFIAGNDLICKFCGC